MKNPFPSKDFYQFIDSMNPPVAHYYGDDEPIAGYNLEVLKRLTESELEDIVKIISTKKSLSWQDIEALDVIGSESALTALSVRLTSPNIYNRLDSAERLYARNILSFSALESIILASIKKSVSSKTLDTVRKFPTLAIKNRLLWFIVFGKMGRGDTAKNIYLIYGQKDKTELDVYNFHKFDSQIPFMRLLFFLDFCRRMDVNPWMTLIKGA
jgi:hypothetical protein